MRGNDLLSSPAVPGKCRACVLCKYTPCEIYSYKEQGYDSYMTLSRSPQCRALSRAVMNEKSSSPLFPVGGWGGGGGAVVTNDWCINNTTSLPHPVSQRTETDWNEQKRTYENTETDFCGYRNRLQWVPKWTGTDFSGYRNGLGQTSAHTKTNFSGNQKR